MSKKTEPLYVVIEDQDRNVFGHSLAGLKNELEENYRGDLSSDDEPYKLPLYKFVGYVELTQPAAPLTVVLPKGV